MALDWPLTLLWLCWAGYWMVAAASRRPLERTEPRASRLLHILLVGSSFFLLFFEPARIGLLAIPIVPEGTASYSVGLSLAVLGLALATWSRIHLGRNWSGAISIRSEQRLLQRGPYALVRHPIYAGLLLAMTGSALAIGALGAALAVSIAAFAYWRKIQIEEGWLVSAFGGDYESYRRRAGALLPFRGIQSSVREALATTRANLLSPGELVQTIDRLQDDGRLSADRGQLLRDQLPHAISESSYVFGHLGAHLTIGAIFAFDIIPLPLGTASRVLWVVANRAYEAARGLQERAAIHSFKVVLIAAIPWLGYGAYLLPLRRESAELTWLLAHHLSYRLHGTSFEEFLSTKPRIIRRAGSSLIPSLSEQPTHDG